MNTVLIFIIGIPLIEIYLFIKIGSQIGAFNTVLLILFTAIILASDALIRALNKRSMNIIISELYNLKFNYEV